MTKKDPKDKKSQKELRIPSPPEKVEKTEQIEPELSAEEQEKRASIGAAVKSIEKSFGRGSIMQLGSNKAKIMVEAIPTGSIALDDALGIGGYPKRRIVELYGSESAGKSSLALHAVASAQERGGHALYVDAEHAVDADYAKAIGVDIDSLWLSQPDYGEQALEIVDTAVRSGGFDIIVVDSVAALVPKVELEGDIGDSHMALQARMMSQALRKLAAIVSNSNVAVIFINQLREKVGIVFGDKEVTPGGRGLKFFSSIRLDVRKIGVIKEGDDVVGNKTRVKVVKNKLAPPLRKAEFVLVYGKGIDSYGEVVDLGVETEVLTKSGAYYYYNDETIGQGRAKAIQFLRDDSKVFEKIRKAVIKAMKQ